MSQKRRPRTVLLVGMSAVTIRFLIRKLPWKSIVASLAVLLLPFGNLDITCKPRAKA